MFLITRARFFKKAGAMVGAAAGHRRPWNGACARSDKPRSCRTGAVGAEKNPPAAQIYPHPPKRKEEKFRLRRRIPKPAAIFFSPAARPFYHFQVKPLRLILPGAVSDRNIVKVGSRDVIMAPSRSWLQTNTFRPFQILRSMTSKSTLVLHQQGTILVRCVKC